MDIMFKLFSTYGIIIIFIVIALEHMNFPGLPAGLIMPGVGAMAANGSISLIEAMIICLIAGIVGSVILYLIGYFGGAKLFDKLGEKFPSVNASIEKAKNIANKDRGFTKVTCRFLPVVRTLISIVEGGMRVKFSKFLVASTIGITLYNGVLIMGGYLLAVGIL